MAKFLFFFAPLPIYILCVSFCFFFVLVLWSWIVDLVLIVLEFPPLFLGVSRCVWSG